MAYGLVATMRTKPGKRDEVIELLLRDQSTLSGLGCRTYLVGRNEEYPDLIYVTEVWESKRAHDDSLRLESTKAAIAEAMPLLTGEFSGHEFTIAGGLGSPE
ncbi:putative quinol monooxygenase [Pseudonocardia spinosispora]|uniref:putative quinol monooxygenase n=1 Tax=Pseudonocardia spinosispora TaxID=103441 RepID=UPI0003F59E35|nr:putative quinol monooxygenase [Pseudonocardia spinosispora]